MEALMARLLHIPEKRFRALQVNQDSGFAVICIRKLEDDLRA